MIVLFVLCILLSISPYGSPALALTCGMLIALIWGNPYPKKTPPIAKKLLKASVVMPGFGMDFRSVLEASKTGFLFAFFSILGTLTLGYILGKRLQIHGKTSALISAGTAICGGSAIAAVAGVIGAGELEISVAMGAVFVLNAAALYLFPILGHALHLTQAQFGVWAGVAIHDVSSVVGAAQSYGDGALEMATAVKLSRTLWIVPVALFFGWLLRRQSEEHEEEGKQKFQIPWFILGFLAASFSREFSLVSAAAPYLVWTARAGLRLTLFLIGLGISRATLRSVGWKALAQALILWFTISVGSLMVVRML